MTVAMAEGREGREAGVLATVLGARARTRLAAVLNASRWDSSPCSRLILATSVFMKRLYALGSRGGRSAHRSGNGDVQGECEPALYCRCGACARSAGIHQHAPALSFLLLPFFLPAGSASSGTRLCGPMEAAELGTAIWNCSLGPHEAGTVTTKSAPDGVCTSICEPADMLSGTVMSIIVCPSGTCASGMG